MNRYYGNSMGRFLTPDPFGGSANRANPSTFNRYAYVAGDPINSNDPSGLDLVLVDSNGRPFVSGGGSIDVSGIYTPILPIDFGSQGYPWLFALMDAYFANAAASQAAGGGGPQKGTGANVFIDPDSVSTSGPEQAVIERILDRLLNVIDRKCSDYLRGAYNVQETIRGLRTNDSIAHALITPTSINAVSSGGLADDGHFQGGAITISRTGAFFSTANTTNNGRLPGNTDEARAFIVLHELGHLLKPQGYESDLNSSAAGRRNNNRIDRNCNETLKRFR